MLLKIQNENITWKPSAIDKLPPFKKSVFKRKFEQTKVTAYIPPRIITFQGKSVSIYFHVIRWLYFLPLNIFSFGHINKIITQNMAGVVSDKNLDWLISVKKLDLFYFFCNLFLHFLWKNNWPSINNRKISSYP